MDISPPILSSRNDSHLININPLNTNHISTANTSAVSHQGTTLHRDCSSQRTVKMRGMPLCLLCGDNSKSEK